MIEGLITLVFGPFILLGIIIAGFGLITGARVDSLLREYARLCVTLFVTILVPAIRGLTYLTMQFGEKLRYVMDGTHQPVNVADYTVHVAPQAQKKSASSKDDSIDVDIVEE